MDVFLDGKDATYAWIRATWLRYMGWPLPVEWEPTWANRVPVQGGAQVDREMASSPEAVKRAQGNRNFFLVQAQQGGGAMSSDSAPSGSDIDAVRQHFRGKGIDLPSLAPGTIDFEPIVVDATPPGPPPSSSRTPYPFEPGIGTSEFKIAGVSVAALVAGGVAVLAQVGIHVTGSEQAAAEGLLGLGIATVSAAYSFARAIRKQGLKR